jgi:alpha-L-rhamnosidase
MACVAFTGLLLSLPFSSAVVPRGDPPIDPHVGVAPEPWPVLSGGGFTGPDQPLSPDPLVRYQFDVDTNDTILQIFAVAAVAVGPAAGTAATAFTNTASAVGNTSCSVGVQGNGTLVVDFGVELPAWLEFDSAELLPVDVSRIQLGISEYDVVDYVGSFKSGPAVQYCSPLSSPGAEAASLCTYRLETNPELYEGVRYGFITLTAAPSSPFTISGLRAVSQAKPVNYTGAFASPGDPDTQRIWYTAAYTVRGA